MPRCCHESPRLDRSQACLDREIGKRFGDAAYCAEELVAEIGSAFLCSELGITQDVRADHAQYLAQWMKLMKEDTAPSSQRPPRRRKR